MRSRVPCAKVPRVPLYALAVLALAVAGACSGGGGDGGGGIVDPIPVATVSMPGNSFSPFNLIIHVNETVSWDFPSDEHDVVFVANPGAPANIPVTSRKEVLRTFGTVGVFPYDCRVHPGMSGQVTVLQ